MAELMVRSELNERDTWKIEDIFSSLSAWEDGFARANSLICALSKRSGTLCGKSEALETLDEYKASRKLVESLFVYARMKRDEDNAVSQFQALTDRAQALGVALGTASAFIRPELLSRPVLVDKMIRDPAFSEYDFFLRELLRARDHTRSAEEEKIIAMAGEILSAPDTIYTLLTDADMKFGTVTGDDGETLSITQSSFVPILMTASRPVRRAVFEQFYGVFSGYSSAIPAIYASSVKADIFSARCRNFPSARAASLFDDDIPESVYDNLIDETKRHIPSLNRYLSICAARLSLDRLQMYDVYVQADKSFSLKLPYDAAFSLVADCLKPLGPDYQALLKKARAERWIDPFENAGKHSGAYAWGTYESHPYVLLNYHENLSGITTLAHELGHAMHTYLANEAQPYFKADYSLFVAEVASTVNEVLLMLELLKRYPAREAQAYLLGSLLNDFRTTLFRQTMFAEFERETHSLAESGEALTGENLNALYAGLNAEYYPACEQNPEIACEWMRIPHFYSAFYVYVYATGFSAATAIAATIHEQGEPAAKRYKDFLRAGGSMHPIEALKLAGIDMASPAPIEKALKLFEALLARYERVAEE